MGRSKSQRFDQLKIVKRILRRICLISVVSLGLVCCAKSPTNVVVKIPIASKDSLPGIRPIPDLPIKHLKETDPPQMVMEAYVQTVLLQNNYINYLKKIQNTR